MTTQMIKALTTATSNPYPVVCWWNDSEISDLVNEAVKQGFARRHSVTQVEWTEKGIAEYKIATEKEVATSLPIANGEYTLQTFADDRNRPCLKITTKRGKVLCNFYYRNEQERDAAAVKNGKIKMNNEIQEIIKTLNKLTAPLFPRKVSDWGNDLHGAIRNAANPYLNELGLRYGVWTVEDKAGRKIFDFNHDFEKDKRSASRNRIGKVSNVQWKACEAFEGFKTLQEGARHFDKLEHQKRIKSAEEWVESAKSKLQEAQDYLEKVQKSEP